MSTELVTLTIDGREISVPRGTNVIEAARLVGVDVPHYCYHPKLAVVGNCRMCLVEMGMPALDPATKAPLIDPATGKGKINWIPRPQIGCATNAAPGMHIRTDTPLIKDCREGVMEFLLINHPLDCPICDQAGECKLQEQSTGYGRGYSRYIEQKNVKPKRTLLGPRVMLDDERCILCSRCIRFSRDVAKDDVLGFIDRGSYSTLTCYPGKRLENNYSLNTVDICPVGALTSTDFRFKMRVWFLKQTPGIDTESSVGANTTVWSREGVIYRITPRRNDAVNDTWMADSGRELYKQVTAPERIRTACIGGVEALPEAALEEAGRLLLGGAVAVVGSGRSTVEEQYLTAKLAAALKAPAFIVTRVGKGDGLLVSADRNPNLRGALVAGLVNALPSHATAPESGYVSCGLKPLGEAIDAGKVRTVLSVGEDLVAGGLTEAQLAKVAVMQIGTTASPTADTAAVLIPGLTVFEKEGTFINQQFRIQKFARAVPGPVGVADDRVTLARLAAAAGAGSPASEIGAVWTAMRGEIPALAQVNYSEIPESGLILDSAPWKDLPFVESEGLHFKPIAGSELKTA
jgi:NADH-quinone oxidoreductase subunit G